jgi:outer membrane biosynthesis protein TonB
MIFVIFSRIMVAAVAVLADEALSAPANQFKPAPTKPAPTKPAPTKPVPTKPVATKPAPTKPAPTKPVPTKPAPTKPAPTKPAPTKPAPAKPVPTKPAPSQLFDRYLVIVLENQSYSTVMSNTYFQNLATKGTLFSSFYAITHPSYPNYLSMVAGSTFGISSNTQVNLQQKSIADLLEAKGLSWKSYAENYPGNCYLGSTADDALYVRKHVPFLSFQSIQNDATRCNYVVPASTISK